MSNQIANPGKMGDYISRAEAVALAMQYYPDDDGVCSKAGHDLRELLDDLENAPPADVRPVVLCRDCKHSHRYGEKWHCDTWEVWNIPEDAFCSFGERRGADMRENSNG